MANNEITVQIKIADYQPVKDLVEVLCSHIDELPPELRQAVQALIGSEDENGDA